MPKVVENNLDVVSINSVKRLDVITVGGRRHIYLGHNGKHLAIDNSNGRVVSFCDNTKVEVVGKAEVRSSVAPAASSDNMTCRSAVPDGALFSVKGGKEVYLNHGYVTGKGWVATHMDSLMDYAYTENGYKNCVVIGKGDFLANYSRK